MSSHSPGPVRRLLPVWIMLGTIAAVVIAGFLVFPRTDDARDALLAQLGTRNQGLLLNPVVDLSQQALAQFDGGQIVWHSDRPVWSVLVVSPGECVADCLEALHSVRQVHVRLDKNAHRVERFLLSGQLDDTGFSTLRTEYPKLVILQPDADLDSRLLANNSAELGDRVRVYLIDPRGVVMMVYRAEQAGEPLLADINHLLKTLP